MESGKPRKRDRLKALLEWKRKETSPTPPQIPTAGASMAVSAPPVQDLSGDSRRATTRYLEAAKTLEKVVNHCKSQWGSFDFPELKGEPINPTDLQFKHKIDTVLEAQKSALKDQTAWEKCKHTIQCVFSALSPFAKNFLAIAANAQSVQSCLSRFLTCLDPYIEPLWAALWWPSFIHYCTLLTYLSNYADCGQRGWKERGG
jgi:hypothetical protein